MTKISSEFLILSDSAHRYFPSVRSVEKDENRFYLLDVRCLSMEHMRILLEIEMHMIVFENRLIIPWFSLSGLMMTFFRELWFCIRFAEVCWWLFELAAMMWRSCERIKPRRCISTILCLNKFDCRPIREPSMDIPAARHFWKRQARHALRFE